MLPTIETIRPNFTQVDLPRDKAVLWFSYNNLIAFRVDDRFYARHNEWSKDTGFHLNTLDLGDKKSRLNSIEFEAAYNREMGSLKELTTVGC